MFQPWQRENLRNSPIFQLFGNCGSKQVLPDVTSRMSSCQEFCLKNVKMNNSKLKFQKKNIYSVVCRRKTNFGDFIKNLQ